MKTLALILGTLCLLVLWASAQETKADLYQATRARDASLAVHKNVMQRIFGINVSYSGVLVPKSKLRRFPILADDTRKPEPFENVSVHPLTGRAEGVTLLSINF